MVYAYKKKNSYPLIYVISLPVHTWDTILQHYFHYSFVWNPISLGDLIIIQI